MIIKKKDRCKDSMEVALTKQVELCIVKQILPSKLIKFYYIIAIYIVAFYFYFLRKAILELLNTTYILKKYLCFLFIELVKIRLLVTFVQNRNL